MIIIALTAALANTAFAQTSEPQITLSEAQEAERVARQFTKRLEQTKDMAPLTEEFFVPEFLEGYLQEGDFGHHFLILKRDVASQVSRAELQRYYIALLNLGYLHALYFYSKYPSTAPDNFPPEERQFPPDVIRLIKKHPYAAAHMRNGTPAGDTDEWIDSAEKLRSQTDFMEKAGELLRRYVIRGKAERTRAYRVTLTDFGQRFRHFQPSLSVCNEKCLGLPVGTRLIKVNVPVFQLRLARVGGRMRIVSTTFFFP